MPRVSLDPEAEEEWDDEDDDALWWYCVHLVKRSAVSINGATTNASPKISAVESNKFIGCSLGRDQSVYSLINVSRIAWNNKKIHQNTSTKKVKQSKGRKFHFEL